MTRRYARPRVPSKRTFGLVERDTLQAVRATAREAGNLALGFACLAFLEASWVVYATMDAVRGRRGGPYPSGGHRSRP